MCTEVEQFYYVVRKEFVLDPQVSGYRDASYSYQRRPESMIIEKGIVTICLKHLEPIKNAFLYPSGSLANRLFEARTKNEAHGLIE